MGAPYLATDGAEITLSDSTDQPVFSAVYVGVGGNVKVTTAADNAITFVGVPSGAIIPLSGVKKIWLTGTTAASLVGLRGA